MHDRAITKAEVRAALAAAGCRPELVETMVNIALNLVNVGGDLHAVIARWRRLKPHWFN